MAKRNKGNIPGVVAKEEHLVSGRVRRCLNGQPLRTTITLIGSGGTGSFIAHGLARMDIALRKLGFGGIHLTAYDDDIVERHNIGRQMYGFRDIGENKAQALIARINRMYGLDWESMPSKFIVRQSKHDGVHNGNIVITCVDNGAVRNQLHETWQANGLANLGEVSEAHSGLKETHYWMDIGNDKDLGQIVLASHELPTCVDVNGHYDETSAKGSCSMEQSLAVQDLFINEAMAVHGLQMLWTLFRKSRIDYHAVYLNLRTATMRRALIKDLKNPWHTKNTSLRGKSSGKTASNTASA